MHKHYVIFDKAVTKLVTFWQKVFFPYLNPTSYLKTNWYFNPFRHYLEKLPKILLKSWGVYTTRFLSYFKSLLNIMHERLIHFRYNNTKYMTLSFIKWHRWQTESVETNCIRCPDGVSYWQKHFGIKKKQLGDFIHRCCRYLIATANEE